MALSLFFITFWLSSFSSEDVSITIHRTLHPQEVINITIPLDTVITPKNQNTSYTIKITEDDYPSGLHKLMFSDAENRRLFLSEYYHGVGYAFFPQCCDEKTPPLYMEIQSESMDLIVNVTFELEFRETIPLSFGNNSGKWRLEKYDLKVFRLDLSTPEFLRNFTFPGSVTVRSEQFEDLSVYPRSAPLMSGFGHMVHMEFGLDYCYYRCQADYNLNSLRVTAISIPLNTPDDLGVYFINAGCPKAFLGGCTIELIEKGLDVSLTATLSYPIPLSLGSKNNIILLNREYQYFSLNLTKLNITTDYPCYVELRLLENTGILTYIAKNYLPSTDNLTSLIHDYNSPLFCYIDRSNTYKPSWKTNELIVLNSEEDLGVYYILLLGYSNPQAYSELEVSLKQPEVLNLDICNTFYLDLDLFLLFKVENFVTYNDINIIEPPIPYYLRLRESYYPYFKTENGNIPTWFKGNATHRNGSYVLIWNQYHNYFCEGTITEEKTPVPYGIYSYSSCNGGHCQVNLNSNKAFCQCKPQNIGDQCQFTCPHNESGVICSGRGHCEEDIFSTTAICNCPPGFIGSQCQLQCNNSTCNSHGTCLVTTNNNTEQVSCLCNNGYLGSSCQIFCSPKVNCSSHGTCEYVLGLPETGRCVCDVGWNGQDCSLMVMMFLETSSWIYSINSILALVGLGVLLVLLVIVLMMRRRNQTDYTELDKLLR